MTACSATQRLPLNRFQLTTVDALMMAALRAINQPSNSEHKEIPVRGRPCLNI